MARKLTNLDSPEPTQIELYSMYELGLKLNFPASTLREWHNDPEKATPAPSFRSNNTDYWTASSLSTWRELIDAEEQKIANMQWSKEQLLDILIERARETEGIAKRAYNRGRGVYSLSGARIKVVELEGAVDFISRMGKFGLAPDEKRQELQKLIRSAKQTLQMQ